MAAPTFYRDILLGVSLALFATTHLPAAPQDTTAATANPPTVNNELALSQSQLADKYQRLEKLMLRMAEYDAARNPRRAELLKKAISTSKETHLKLQLETLVKLLNEDKLSRAIGNQQIVSKDLQALLDLLLTENRPDRLKDQKDRIRNYIKDVERILRMQGGVQGRTEGGVDPKRLATEQERVAQRTQILDQRISENEQPDGQSQDGENKDGENKDGESQDGENKDGQSKDGQSKDGQSKDAESKDGESKDGQSKDGQSKDAESKDGQSKDGQSKDGQSKEGQSKDAESKDAESQDAESKDAESKDGQSKDGQSKDGQSKDGQSKDGESKDAESQEGQQQPGQQQQDSDFPGRKKLQEAERRMRDAQQRLAEAKRKEAIEEQELAREALEQAKAQLEEILRQMREEEIERTLAQLEVRFRKMLEMQLQVYENTVRLGKIPPDRRDRHVDIQSGKLSFQERRIVIEAEKCIALLREEGSSVAFPESVDQMRADMEQVVDRLARTRIDRITQGIEEDIIQALDEMVEALQQAQEEQEQRQQQQQQQQQQQGDPDDQPLVDKIAELKMLKALQIRINKRTKRYARLLDDTDDPAGQADDEDLVDSLQKLADRELRLHEITRDIVLEKNE